MSGARAVRIYTGAVFFLFVAISGLFMAAGGLGLAASAGMIGLLWSPMLAWPALEALRRPPPALVLFALFVVWAAISLSWSPYDRPDQALKLLLLTPLFVLFPYGVSRLDARRRERFAAFAIIVLSLTGVYFAIEALLGAPLATAVKIAEGAPPPEARILAMRTISRGASAFVLAAGPAALFLWLHRRRLAAGALLVTAALAAAGFNVDANIAALAAGAAAGIAAWLNPRRALPVMLYAAGAGVLLTPLILSAIVALVSEDVAAGLPFSWHQRLEIWAYSLERLGETPFLGLGL
ncbi:MAG: hypothetical protein ACLFQ5_13625, partial [Oceanicaulis sp.]